jgi:hypothetical protein
MSQNLTNDLPDKFGSSDEDDDDDEVMGWIGDSGEFEARSRDHGEFEDDDEDEGDEFGRRDLFHHRWDGEYHEDDEFGFRGLGSGLLTEEPDVRVQSLVFSMLTRHRALRMKTMVSMTWSQKTKSV